MKRFTSLIAVVLMSIAFSAFGADKPTDSRAHSPASMAAAEVVLAQAPATIIDGAAIDTALQSGVLVAPYIESADYQYALSVDTGHWCSATTERVADTKRARGEYRPQRARTSAVRRPNRQLRT